MRMAAMYHERRLIKTSLEEFLISLDDEPGRTASHPQWSVTCNPANVAFGSILLKKSGLRLVHRLRL